MDAPPRQIIDNTVPATCLSAGALLVERDGHVVVGHYGSVPGEIAVCMKSVGLADRSDLGTLELRGASELLDRALASRLGHPAIAPGSGRRLQAVWYLRLGARRALLVGPHTTLSAGAPIGKGADRAELPYSDIRSSIAMISVIGPRAGRLLAAAGLPNDLAIGAVVRDPGDGDVIAILRERQRRFLAIVRAAGADALWGRLLSAGEQLGAAFVGCDALTLLDASSAQTA